MSNRGGLNGACVTDSASEVRPLVWEMPTLVRKVGETSKPMRIAIASGKGGTGKTTFATSLALALAETGARIAYVDCDVEEPNGHIFLKPTQKESRDVSILVPEVDESRCTLCGACGRACHYSAIVVLPKKVLTFPKLCHGCGGCSLACSEGAIREVPRAIGVVEQGVAGAVTFLQGKLHIGEAMAPPVIRAVLAATPDDRTLVLDAPPGTSCPVIESIKTADVVLLVTEPTPFGLNDLKLAVETVRELGVPFGVAVNRADIGDDEVRNYCAQEHIPVLLEIRNDRAIAQAYSRGVPAVTALPELSSLFFDLFEKLVALARSAPQRMPKRQGGVAVTRGEHESLPSETVTLGGKRNLRELVVISGKGGTGKTSIVASFFALADKAAVADCDVDAADLHLVLDPTERLRWPFKGGQKAAIDSTRCIDCGACAERCRFDAIRAPDGKAALTYEVDSISCEGCGVCVDACQEGAITLASVESGEWFISDTRYGPMIHARLGIAQENSGKLVSLVRREARAYAASNGRKLLICDGSPGIGCPVIASITGADLALIVTEPTLSGLHDLKRVADLCEQLHVKTAICINKADINPDVALQIDAEAVTRGIPVLGHIRYDESVTRAQVKRIAVVESGESQAAVDIRALWARVATAIA